MEQDNSPFNTDTNNQETKSPVNSEQTMGQPPMTRPSPQSQATPAMPSPSVQSQAKPAIPSPSVQSQAKPAIPSPSVQNPELEFLKTIPNKYLNKTYFIIAAVVIFLVGLFFGMIIFGGQTKAPAPTGLAGVIVNPEVPPGRKRCGMVEYGQGCVLYIVNSNRREVTAKELYPLAANMTKVPEYIIETSNLRYNNKLIEPGYIAQINIQPIR